MLYLLQRACWFRFSLLDNNMCTQCSFPLQHPIIAHMCSISPDELLLPFCLVNSYSSNTLWIKYLCIGESDISRQFLWHLLFLYILIIALCPLHRGWAPAFFVLLSHSAWHRRGAHQCWPHECWLRKYWFRIYHVTDTVSGAVNRAFNQTAASLYVCTCVCLFEPP